MLEIRHLRTLIAILEAGNVSAAAKRVHLTQSAISHQIKWLEEHYGLPMLERKGRSFGLTEAGKRLADLGKRVLAETQSAERELSRLKTNRAGVLRIALECHTCFDWLMPVMDAFRTAWPDVELDLVSGFHSNPVDLLDDRADVVILSDPQNQNGVIYHPLFKFEMLAVLPTDHKLKGKRFLMPADFADETLISYPVPEERIDLLREVLFPNGIRPARRTAELTVAILQLVASRRGIAALPSWGLRNYLEHDYVIAKRIGKKGLWSSLFAATTRDMAERPYLADFLNILRSSCFANLQGIAPI